MPTSWPQVQAFHPQLWRAVCGYELNPALREELMQDVLLAIWQALPALRESERLLPFVLRIAHNLGASHIRVATRSPAPLPLPLRQPLMLQLEGFDYAEISDLLGISTENVGMRLHRARSQLKALLSHEETSDE